MKTMKLAALALALTGIFAAGNALAATTTADVTVNATINASCSASTTSNITFAAIDPLTTTGLVNSSSQGGATQGVVNVKCTAGTTVTFGAPATGTLNSALTSGTMTYSTLVPSGTLTPGFAGTDYNVNATIAQAQYQAAPAAADYTDTFTVTITY
jgi:spore coat protein U domain-containing protein, fimbrial subunit CupE1/2/3/6